MQFFLQSKKKLNKITFGRKIDKCIITTDKNYLTNFDKKLFFQPSAKLRHYTGTKTGAAWQSWHSLAETTVDYSPLLL